MKYYICEVVRFKEPVNGKDENYSMNSRDTENDARIVYLDKMKKGRADENVTLELVYIMDENGGPILTECYRPEPEPQPEPEPVPPTLEELVANLLMQYSADEIRALLPDNAE